MGQLKYERRAAPIVVVVVVVVVINSILFLLWTVYSSKAYHTKPGVAHTHPP